MPTIYCAPKYNLGNRLITILSWVRIARMWDYDFVLIWPTTPDEGCFVSCFGELFKADFEINRSLPSNLVVQTPRFTSQFSRHFALRPSIATDVYACDWKHFVFDESDLSNFSTIAFTEDIRRVASNILNLTDRVVAIGQALGYTDEKKWRIAIHNRGNAWLYNGWTQGTLGSVESLVAAAGHIIKEIEGEKSIFVASGDITEGVAIAESLSNLSKDIFLTRAHSFVPSFLNHCLACLDLLAISRSQVVINSGVTTFSSLGALIGNAILYTIIDNKTYAKRSALVGSGYGL